MASSANLHNAAQRMRYGSLVSLAAVLFALGAWKLGALVLIWPALSFGLVALGYFGLGAWMLGKQRDGTRKAWGYVLAGPFIVFMHALRFALTKARWREDPWNEVVDGIYVGRLVPLGELPSDVQTVVDLTSEHLEDPAIREAKTYVCLPTLDGSAPGHDELVDLLRQREEWPGAIYVHCAAGHGRSALVAACLVVLGGLSESIDEAMTLMKQKRPKVHLVPHQRGAAIRAAKTVRAESA
ncbi:MAG: protein-tyrosine phosphatase [Polyangiales bacterium]|jgi:protein-tyrosine phosphatase